MKNNRAADPANKTDATSGVEAITSETKTASKTDAASGTKTSTCEAKSASKNDTTSGAETKIHEAKTASKTDATSGTKSASKIDAIRDLRTILMGTPAFALPTLKALSENTTLIAVITQPDRGRDRKGRPVEGPVKKAATEMGYTVFPFEKLNKEADAVRAMKPDLIVTCAYGQIISQAILDIPRLGVINVHGSILPAYRGSAPIQRALMAGETETGITIMKTDAGVDTGDVLSVRRVPIDPDDYLPDLSAKLAAAGADLLIETLAGYVSGEIAPKKQDDALATYAPRIEKSESYLDFAKPAVEVRNTVRGVGYGLCEYNGETVKVFTLDLEAGNKNAAPGEIIALGGGITVACGEGAVTIRELQMSGKTRQQASTFLNGSHMQTGERFAAVKR